MTARRRSRTRTPAETQETAVTMLDAPVVTIEEPDHRPEDDRSRDALSQRVPALRPLSPVPTYVGIAVTLLGFVLILLAWGQTAGEVNVALQVPYLISAGLTGLGLVMVGVTIVNISAKRRDSALREQQTELLADALRELSAALDTDRLR